MRGRITSYHQLSLTIGMLATGLLGYFLITEVPSGWRVRTSASCVANDRWWGLWSIDAMQLCVMLVFLQYLNAFLVVPALLQCVLMALIPESPWWLMKNKGRDEVRGQPLIYACFRVHICMTRSNGICGFHQYRASACWCTCVAKRIELWLTPNCVTLRLRWSTDVTTRTCRGRISGCTRK